ncbi:hypothetical protein DID88_005020 [Monilinia fructigena]|uniref:Proteasome subunit beta n=1 Tax=Monilinia fructigena TaxID=38457 RepID=A0A395IRH9_9HELO|nr:hypothetical protein DID88_005020 [Monilinia fructigena]
MNHLPQAWGRPRDDVYGAYDASYLQQSGPKSAHSITHPDNLASYGSLARFTDVKRLRKFADTSVVGFGGDVSDMQYLDRLLKSLDTEEAYGASGHTLNAHNLHKYLSKVLYKRRSDFNPLWNTLLVAGLDENDKPFLASADLLGTTFSSPSLATGYGAHLSQPLLRKVAPDEEAAAKLTKEDAIEAVKESMKVLFYRDARRKMSNWRSRVGLLLNKFGDMEPRSTKRMI